MVVEPLLEEALRCGVSMAAFWAMTPRETCQVLAAEAWRLEQEHRARAWLAWHVAALVRTKQMPALERLLRPVKAKALQGEDLERQRREFAEMKARFHV